MSNGIGPNPLNPLSKIYLEYISEKKDDTYLEPDMKKRQANNEKARKDMEKMGTKMKNPHFEEKQQGWDAHAVAQRQRVACMSTSQFTGLTFQVITQQAGFDAFVARQLFCERRCDNAVARACRSAIAHAAA